jgi:hypothetical protein
MPNHPRDMGGRWVSGFPFCECCCTSSGFFPVVGNGIRHGQSWVATHSTSFSSWTLFSKSITIKLTIIKLYSIHTHASCFVCLTNKNGRDVSLFSRHRHYFLRLSKNFLGHFQTLKAFVFNAAEV